MSPEGQGGDIHQQEDFRAPQQALTRPAERAPVHPVGSHRIEEEIQMRISFSARNPFKFLFGTTRREQYVERYVLREHKKGRAFAAILDDPYVHAWSSPEERARLLERPNVVAAVGDHALADLRAAIARDVAATPER